MELSELSKKARIIAPLYQKLINNSLSFSEIFCSKYSMKDPESGEIIVKTGYSYKLKYFESAENGYSDIVINYNISITEAGDGETFEFFINKLLKENPEKYSMIVIFDNDPSYFLEVRKILVFSDSEWYCFQVSKELNRLGFFDIRREKIEFEDIKLFLDQLEFEIALEGKLNDNFIDDIQRIIIKKMSMRDEIEETFEKLKSIYRE